jgi:hypothetical protein
MNGMQTIDAFQLDDQLLTDHQIEVMDVDPCSSIEDRISLLELERDVRSSELKPNRTSVGGLDQSRPELAMNGNATADDSMHKIFEVIVEI